VFPHFDEIVAAVPESERYPRLDELEASSERLAAASSRVELWTPGASRAGRPHRCLEVAGGPLRATLIGLPHADERVGSLALEFLLPTLADGLADELGFSFSVVVAGDPDAALLNEPWLEEPYDLAGYLLRAYRPASFDQSDLTFPSAYKRYEYTGASPEAEAVARVIRERPLDFHMGLHNSALGGAHCDLSEEDARLQEELAAAVAAAKLPLHWGEPPLPYQHRFAPGFFRTVGLADDYDFHAAFGADPAVVLTSGTSSADYAASAWGCFTLAAEVPCFTSPKIADASSSGFSRREARLRGLEALQELLGWLLERYVAAAPMLTRDSPWQRAVHAHLSAAKYGLRAERRQAETLAEYEQEATVAQYFDSVYVRELGALIEVGMFVNMLDAEPVRHAALDALAAEAAAEVRTRVARLVAAGGIEAPPIRRLAQCQVAALLCTLVAVRERHPRRRSRVERQRGDPPLAAM